MITRITIGMVLTCCLALSPTAHAAYVKSYRITSGGQVTDQGSQRLYQGQEPNSSWGLDSVTNSFEATGAWGTTYWRPLTTGLFTVSDILDVTYADSGLAYVVTTKGNYRITSGGQVTDQGSQRLYQGQEPNSSWGLDSATNSFEATGAWGTTYWRPLTTGLFTVSDILDVTYADSGLAYVTVSVPISEPETYSMLLTGLGLLGFMSRRKKDFA